MKPSAILVLMLAVAAAYVASHACAAPDVEPTVPGGRFAFALDDLDGVRVSADDPELDGRVVLIDVWGSWCAPCRTALGFLEELHDEHADDGLTILGVAFEYETDPAERRRALRALVEAEGIGYRILDGGTTADVATSLPSLEGFRGFPTMIVVGRDGTVRHANTVFVPDELDEIRAEVEAALAAN